MSSLFRPEAVEARSKARSGDVARVIPDWIGLAFPATILLSIGLCALLLFGRIQKYSHGPAVVRMSGKSVVTAPLGGTVQGIEVMPGQRVNAGDVLSRFYDADASAELLRAQREFDARLVDVMQDPGNQTARQAVARVLADKQAAASRVAERVIRAPHAGTVSDIRVRPGQHLEPGEPLLSVVPSDAALQVIMLLPGGDRPQLKPGMRVRFEVDGYPYAFQELTIERVGDEVIGPAEARRYLGQQFADSLDLSGTLIVVEARLQTSTFTAEGTTYSYHDGMSGQADVELASDRILVALVPGLRRIL